ncbi:MAG: FAD-dependent oxidoreductase [Gemmatimonadota bacterium]
MTAAAVTPDALVVGAGVVGAACARALAQAGLRVELLEAGFLGGGATGAGMGHIVVMDDSPAQLALTRASSGLLAELMDELPADVELVRTGTLWIAADAVEIEGARAKVDAYRAAGVAAELLDGAALAEAEPELRPGLAGAARVPEDAVLYPPALARWLAAAPGLRVREGSRVSALEGGGVVLEDGSRRSAGSVVLATGAAAAQLAPGLPVMPRRGHLLVSERYPDFCRHQLVELGYLRSAHDVRTASVAFNVQPRATGQLLIGSSRELVGWEAGVNRGMVARMLARACAYLPRLAALQMIRTWTGFRPATPDGLPLIGRWPRVPDTWVAVGHEGLGITTALATGRLLAELVTGAAPFLDPAPYDPLREPVVSG